MADLDWNNGTLQGMDKVEKIHGDFAKEFLKKKDLATTQDSMKQWKEVLELSPDEKKDLSKDKQQELFQATKNLMQESYSHGDKDSAKTWDPEQSEPFKKAQKIYVEAYGMHKSRVQSITDGIKARLNDNILPPQGTNGSSSWEDVVKDAYGGGNDNEAAKEKLKDSLRKIDPNHWKNASGTNNDQNKTDKMAELFGGKGVVPTANAKFDTDLKNKTKHLMAPLEGSKKLREVTTMMPSEPGTIHKNRFWNTVRNIKKRYSVGSVLSMMATIGGFITAGIMAAGLTRDLQRAKITAYLDKLEKIHQRIGKLKEAYNKI